MWLSSGAFLVKGRENVFSLLNGGGDVSPEPCSNKIDDIKNLLIGLLMKY